MRASGFLSAQIVVSLICAERLSVHPSPYPPFPVGRGDREIHEQAAIGYI